MRQINEVIEVEISLNFKKFNLDVTLPLVLLPLNRPFPFRKSKRILRVLSIIEFITPYTSRKQALHHFGHATICIFYCSFSFSWDWCDWLSFCFAWGVKSYHFLRYTPFLYPLFHRDLTRLCHYNWQVVLKSLRNNFNNDQSWGEDKLNMHQPNQNLQDYMK